MDHSGGGALDLGRGNGHSVRRRASGFECVFVGLGRSGEQLASKLDLPSAVATTCLALSLGSLVYGVGGVFLYLNGVMSWIARPLTQPTRFLTVALVALSVLAGFGFDTLRQRFESHARWVGVGIAGALLLDFVWVGGGSLQLPTTPLPGGECVQSLEDPEGAVMVWPDAIDGAQGRSQLLQLLHERPAAHTGLPVETPQEKSHQRTPRRLNPVGAAGKADSMSIIIKIEISISDCRTGRRRPRPTSLDGGSTG